MIASNYILRLIVDINTFARYFDLNLVLLNTFDSLPIIYENNEKFIDLKLKLTF